MGRSIKSFSLFEDKARIKFGDVFKYIEDTYQGLYKDMIMICPIHGKITMKPHLHLKSKTGCKQCGILNFTSTKKEFCEKSILLYGDIFRFNKVIYIRSGEDIILVCDNCGKDFPVTPNNHLTKKRGCPWCSEYRQRMDDEVFQIRAYGVHQGEYDYMFFKFKTMHHKSLILCNGCGNLFSQTPDAHLGGHGCSPCHGHGFNSNLPGILYYFLDLLTNLYKIGITNRTIKHRFGNAIFKNIKIISVEYFEKGKDAYDKEQSILKEFSEHQQYNENFKGNGATEFFSIDVLKRDQLLLPAP